MVVRENTMRLVGLVITDDNFRLDKGILGAKRGEEGTGMMG
jgi:hypothetical protein